MTNTEKIYWNGQYWHLAVISQAVLTLGAEVPQARTSHLLGRSVQLQPLQYEVLLLPEWIENNSYFQQALTDRVQDLLVQFSLKPYSRAP